MKKKLLILSLVLGVSATLFFVLLQTNSDSENTTKAVTSTGEDSLLTNIPQLIEKTPAPNTEQQSSEGDDYNPYESEVFKGQVQQVADLYKQTAEYPIGSQPITNLADVRQPKPFEETTVDTPFETESGDTIGVSAAVNRFQYFTNDTVIVRLTLTGVPEDASIKATASIAGSKGDTGLNAQLQARNGNRYVLTSSFDTSLAAPNSLSTEMIAKVLIDVGGEPFFTTVGFNYNSASAQLNGLGLVKPNGPNLEIPLQYSVFVSGYYFFSGVLYEQQSDRPLIALQTEGRMPQGNGRLVAKAHVKALKAAGSEGPYVLRNIKAYRGAERGEQFDSPVSSIESQFVIQRYTFTDYQDEDFNDPLSQERVDFLNKLGQPDNDQETE